MRTIFLFFIIVLFSSGLLYNQNVAINATGAAAHPSAGLQVDFTNKGVLLPRIALSSRTDSVTIASPAVGLIVYTLGSGGLTYPGYVVWSGTEWRSLSTGTLIPPTISLLNCAGATLSPATFTTGVPYSGVLLIPYTGGNGGSYPTQASVLSTGVLGLSATLQPGTLASGSGFISFTVTGTPLSSGTANFAISFLSQSCTASVSGTASSNASITTSAYVGSYYGQVTNGISFGNYRFRINKRASAPTNNTDDFTSVEIMYTGPVSITIMSYASTMLGGGQLDWWPPNLFGLGTTDTRNTNLLLSNQWYSWGEPGIITNSSEKRQFIFTGISPTDKDFYRIEFMVIDPTPYIASGDSYTDMKVVIYVERITGP